MEEKRCSKCGAKKAKTEFHKDKRSATGVSSQCKECRHVARIHYYTQKREHECMLRRLWKKNNPEATRAHRHTHRARKKEAEGFFTHEDLSSILLEQENKCFYCQESLKTYEIEHMTPLCRGGSNWPSNICLSCSTCNGSKGSRTAEEFMALKAKEIASE